MKIVILGGSGFIGENLAKNLIEKNFKVLILDKKPSFKFPNLFQYFDSRLEHSSISAIGCIIVTFFTYYNLQNKRNRK